MTDTPRDADSAVVSWARGVGRGRRRGVAVVGGQYRAAERALSALLLVALGAQQSVVLGASLGLILAAVVIPVWVTVAAKSVWAGVFFWLGLAVTVWGIGLSLSAAADHVVLRHNAYATTFLFLEIVFGACVLFWASMVHPLWRVGVFFGIGLVINGLLRPGPLAATDPLKFVWLVPLSVLVLAVLDRPGRLAAQLIGLVALGLLSVISDARGFFGTALVAGVLLAWQLRPKFSNRRSSWLWTAGLFAALVFAVYNLASKLLINGYLGTAAQQRSVQQVEETGSLLLGGRPELSATWALLSHEPGGFGVGVVANLHEINIAKEGMSTINYDPNNGYVDRFMFGSSVELHSVFGDLWAAFGLGGIVFTVFTVIFIVVMMSRLVAAREASGIVLFFSVWGLWSILFSPLPSAAPTLLLIFGLLLSEDRRLRRRTKAAEANELPTDSRASGRVVGTASASLGWSNRDRAPARMS